MDCGLGVLSTVVSKYAKKVIAVEASYLADSLLKIVAANKIENIIVIKKHIDDIESLPEDIEKVDIVMSQYMGYLFYDKALLSRLLKARDRFLKPSGIMMPDCIEVLISGLDYGQSVRIEQDTQFKLGHFSSEPKKEIVPERVVSTNIEF